MSQSFLSKKQDIIKRLSTPDEDYTDASPKGSVDEHIRKLVDGINSTDGFVTTSSCSGRIAVFLEGGPNPAKNQRTSTAAEAIESDTSKRDAGSIGCKGGGRWLFTSHDPVELNSQSNEGATLELLGLPARSQSSYPDPNERPRYLHFKFEPMVSSNVLALFHSAQCESDCTSLLRITNLPLISSHAYRSCTSSPPPHKQPK